MTDNIFEMISDADLLGFNNAFKVPSWELGSRLFPDTKTKNINAMWLKLSAESRIPSMAFVHALDTEARIGSRAPFSLESIEKLLIKEKLPQSERVQELMDRGIFENEDLRRHLFDDFAILATRVMVRANVAKAEALTSGKMTVIENDLGIELDYGVPTENKMALNWSDPDHDILTDIQNMVVAAEVQGYKVNKAITSPEVRNAIAKNNSIRTAINGSANAGKAINLEMINGLLGDYGLVLETTNELYSYETVVGGVRAKQKKRYFDPTKFVLVQENGNGAIGSGIWGVTPEERAAQAFNKTGSSGFVFMSQWFENDPVTKWSKASGYFVPALPDPEGLVIGDITLATTPGPFAEPFAAPLKVPESPQTTSDDGLGTLSVTSVAGNSVGETVVTVDGNSGDLVYTVTNAGSTVTIGKKLSGTTPLDGASPFELDVGVEKNGKFLTVIEVDGEGNSVAYKIVELKVKTE